MNVPPTLSTGLSWLWGCREKRGREHHSVGRFVSRPTW